MLLQSANNAAALANIIEGRPRFKAKNKTTLIVCPSSLCSQWLQEVQKHIEPGVVGDVAVHRSGSRVQSLDPVATLKSYGIVITTYQEVMQNYPSTEAPSHLVTEEEKAKWWAAYYEKHKGPLLRVSWHRVILDECQQIKNHLAKTSVACRMLCAKYRWLLSGTPLQNGLEDLGGYFMFLNVPGAGNWSNFQKNFSGRSENKYQRLDAILRAIMVRRTGSNTMFGRPILSLPALSHETVLIELHPTERAIYNIVKVRFKQKLNSWSINGVLQKHARNILTMFLRLRQMCAHVLIVIPLIRDLLEAEDLEKLWALTEKETQPQDPNARPGTITILRRMLAKTNANKDMTEELDGDRIPSPEPITGVEPNRLSGVGAKDGRFKFRKYLRRLFDDGTWGEIVERSPCYRCNEAAQDPRIVQPCGHLYCEECLNAIRTEASRAKASPRCMECSQEIKSSDRLRAYEEVPLNSPGQSRRNSPLSPEPDQGDVSWIDAPGAPLLSTKVQAVKTSIRDWMDKDSSCKIIVFSFFLPTLKVLEKVADREDWGWVEYTGKMNVAARDRAIEEYRDDPEKRIMFASMKCGGLGLNLTMACKCIIIDPWWNQSVEDQSFSRVFRIGQRKDVEVRRLLVQHTVDTDMMLKLQEKKNKEINRVIGSGRPASNLQVKDLLRLFGPVQKDPKTGRPIVGEDEDVDEFVLADDQPIQDDSDADVPNTVPAKPFL